MNKKEKTTLNVKNKNDKCLQHVLSVSLNCGEIESHSERISDFKIVDKL